MKAFLMYRDRDFDPKEALPANQEALTQDLELNTLFRAMSGGDRFLLDIARQAVLSSLRDPQAIRYRQDILRDCLKNGAVIRELYQIPLESIRNKREKYLGLFGVHYPRSLLGSAVKLIEMFVELLKKLRKIADAHAAEFESEGFRRFFAMIEEELDDAYLAEVDEQVAALQFRKGVLLSAQLGPGNEGADYMLRKPGRPQHWVKQVLTQQSPSHSFSIHPRDDHAARALADIRDRGMNLVANAAAQSAEHMDSFFNMLRIELAFYVGCLNLYEQLAGLDEPICFPDPAVSAERRHSFKELYDVCLALTMKSRVVGNDAQADGREIVMITGANQGGKTTFLRSIGLAQLMMQCGMFVPAESFSANVCSGVLTHFRREEDATMRSGKLDEELGRMSEIINLVAPDALVLFNESFSATNEREGSEIARQIVAALLQKRIKVFFVTHLYAFARGIHERQIGSAFFLRAERQADGARTFKLNEGEPLETAFGGDLFQEVFGAQKSLTAR
jgi:DNA mismatch repair ATPase MutS